jgi:hypothetical protein
MRLLVLTFSVVILYQYHVYSGGDRTWSIELMGEGMLKRKREEGGNKSGPLLAPIESGLAEFEMTNFWGLECFDHHASLC